MLIPYYKIICHLPKGILTTACMHRRLYTYILCTHVNEVYSIHFAKHDVTASTAHYLLVHYITRIILVITVENDRVTQ